ncbi:MAG: assimilatory nitrate reductase catalytic subunit [Betaproteobacteria bacterium]|jgi:assimilatory nitrate reductase catalytic subunit|nr:assimilatory nitrate reductase catalytic subunit [Betaproteobacteria bacterium]
MKVCRLDDIVPDSGVCALVAGEQVAVFRIAEQIYAVGNRDPFSGANVLSRGIVGDLKGELVVASPVFKQHFSLRTGRCLEDASVRVPVYAARVEDGFVVVEPRKEVATTCCYCGVGCGVLASVFQGEITSVRGDPAHPANRGQLCTKGTTLHLSQQPDFRLLHPELRTERGKLRKRASWDEALDLAARRFSACIAEHGPDSVAFYISGQLLTEDYYVFNKLAKGLIGTNNVDTNSRLCMSSAVAGYKLSLGADAPPCCYEDIDHADLILVAGSNTAFAHPILFRRIEEARAKNPDLKLIVIDPRLTETARAADVHLAIKPGTDVALFNSMLHVMARDGLLDKEYIRAHTEGFQEMKAWPPERAAQICEIPAEKIVGTAWAFASARAALSLYCQGLNQSVNGTHKNSALINLHLATGQIGRPGAGPFSLTGQPNAMGGREVGGMANLLSAHRDLASEKDRAEVAKLWGIPTVPSQPGKTAVEMFQALEKGQIKAIWIACTNPAQSMPDAQAVRRALAKAQFVVVQETFRDAETCEYADVLLPAAGWAEKEGTVTNSERRISRVRAAIRPPGEARPDWKIVVDFARRLGGAKLFPYETAEEVFNEHRETTRGRDLDITGLSYGLLEERGPQQWPFVHEGRKRLYEDGIFPMPSGRARFVATEYVPPAETPDADFPLRLNTGRLRDHWHTMTRTGLVARLFGHSPEPEINLNAHDLKRLEIVDGDLVRVSSRRGDAVLKARASDELRRGDTFVAMHWGSRFSGGAGANALTLSAFDPYSKQPELKYAAVRVERIAPAWRRRLACPATPDAQRAASALLGRFDYAALSLSGDLLCAELAAIEPPDAKTLAALEDVFGTGIADAPRARAVCACFSVSEEAIRGAAQAGATLARLQAELKCGTNCGSCIPELRRMLRDEAPVTT